MDDDSQDSQQAADGQQLAERAHNLKRGNQIGLAASVLRMVAIIIVLAIVRRDHESCSMPLHEWAAVLLAADLLRTPLRLQVLTQLCALEQALPHRSAIRSEDHGAAHALTQAFDAIDKGRAAVLSRWASLAVLALNAVGVAWLLQAGACAETSPHLYRLCLALTLVFGTFVGLNICCSCAYAGLVLAFRSCGPRLIRWTGWHLGDLGTAGGLGPGLDAGELAEIVTVLFAPAVHTMGSSCAVCLSDFEAGEVCRKLECGHVFHKACADEWLMICARCPLCNRDNRPTDPSGRQQPPPVAQHALESELGTV